MRTPKMQTYSHSRTNRNGIHIAARIAPYSLLAHTIESFFLQTSVLTGRPRVLRGL
jgi:hypothetical protein